MIPHTDPRVTSFSTLSGPTAACSTLSGPAVVCVSNLQPCPGRPPPAQSCPGQRPATGRSLFKFVQTGRRLLNLVLTGGPRLLTNVQVGRRLLSQEHTAGCTYHWMQHCFLVHSFILSSSNVKSMTEACGSYCHPHCSASKRKRELFCKNRMSRKSPILHVAPMWTHNTPPNCPKNQYYRHSACHNYLHPSRWLLSTRKCVCPKVYHGILDRTVSTHRTSTKTSVKKLHTNNFYVPDQVVGIISRKDSTFLLVNN